MPALLTLFFQLCVDLCVRKLWLFVHFQTLLHQLRVLLVDSVLTDECLLVDAHLEGLDPYHPHVFALLGNLLHFFAELIKLIHHLPK